MERDKVTKEQQALFDDGHDIEDLARKLHFPNGINLKPASPLQWPKVIGMTDALIHNGQARIYEAAMQYKGVMCAIDVLDNHGKKEISIFEIKRSRKVKTVHIHDMALQYWVATNNDYKVKKICLVQPIEDEEKQVITGFSVKDFTEMVFDEQRFVEQHNEKQFNLLLHETIPDTPIGDHCEIPYKCSFYHYCRR